MRVSSLLAAPFLLLGTLSFAAPAPPASSWSVTSQPARLVNGSPVLFRVRAPKAAHALSGHWLSHDLEFSFDAKTGTWFALGGVSLETKPGTYPVELRADDTPDHTTVFTRQVRVFHQRYPTIVLTVPGKYTAPNPEDQRKIEADQQVKADAFKTASAAREWSGSFELPVKEEISDVFGIRRTFNGSVKSTHQGLDFRAPAGTAVKAINDGTVVLARPMFFEGNFVVLDHGQGLLSLYLHLSKIDVKEGDRVSKGQEIAVSGGTGRATGPHLHLAIRWQGVYLNPAVLFSLRLP